MEILNGFKAPKIAKKILIKLNKDFHEPITIMEVCGTHTMSIMKSGLKELLPKNIKLISGPGCPVCVTPQNYIDTAIELSRRDNIIVATFGDLIRIPGTSSTLQKEKALGGDVRVVYSPLEALTLAKENSSKEVVFLGVGFETTAPIIALAIYNARKLGIKNFSVLNSLKTMPQAMERLVFDSDLKIDGFICPGHVATIIGNGPFEKLARDNNLPLVIAGFETIDIVAAIYRLVDMKKNGESKLVNLYGRLVKEKGNEKALTIMEEVFSNDDSIWRGLGKIKSTGFIINERYMEFDAVSKLKINSVVTEVQSGCLCGDILKGIKEPYECKLYGKICTPITPVGACMVSEEGTCAAYYKYS